MVVWLLTVLLVVAIPMMLTVLVEVMETAVAVFKSDAHVVTLTVIVAAFCEVDVNTIIEIMAVTAVEAMLVSIF